MTNLGTTNLSNSDDFGSTKLAPDYDTPKRNRKKIPSNRFGVSRKVAKSVGQTADDEGSDGQGIETDPFKNADEVIHNEMLENWQELMKVTSVGHAFANLDQNQNPNNESTDTFYVQPVFKSPNANSKSQTNYLGKIWHNCDINGPKNFQKQNYQQNHYPHLHNKISNSRKKNAPINKFNSFGKMPHIQVEPLHMEIANEFQPFNFTLNENSNNNAATEVGDYIDKFCGSTGIVNRKNHHRDSTTSALTELFNKAGPERPQDMVNKTPSKLSKNKNFQPKKLF
jgi:hypothetical protein